MAAGNDEEEGGGGDGDSELSRAETCQGSGSRRSAEKALEEAVSTGVLSLSGRRMKGFPRSARNYDLTDITRADLSKNRFSEMPSEMCQLVSLESLNLYHNCLRLVPPAISNLQVLTYLNISRNLLPSLPPSICRLPLTVLIASNNKLGSLPEEIGTMTSLRQLDVSCNDLQTLPPHMGSLECLRDLNLRRNQLSVLPDELSDLPLIRLDLSCNRITHIPVCYRHLRHLQTIILDNNPLQYPPAQICLKGKVHIFKYLNIEACNKPVSELGVKLSRPTSLTTCLTEEIYSSRPYGALDSGFNSVDSGSKRWSGNESADELTDLSLRIAGFIGDSKQLREKHNGTEGDAEHTDVESINEEEEDTKSDCGLQMSVTPQEKHKPDHHSTPRTEEKPLVFGRAPSSVSPTTGRSDPPAEERLRPDPPAEERRRPETLLLWRERERQQLQQKQEALRRQSIDRKESLHKVSSSHSTFPATPPSSDVANGPADTPSRLRSQGSQSSISNPTSPTSLSSDSFVSATQKPSSFLFRSYSRGGLRGTAASSPSDVSPMEQCSPVRLRNPRPPFDEKALLLQLRKDIESRLPVTLREPIGESLANGVMLCQLLNHLRPRTIPSIHVPSPAVPKLNAIKCRKNVDSFLDACRRIGVPERDLCLATDILGGEHPLIVQRTVSCLLLLPPGEASSLPPTSELYPEASESCPPPTPLLTPYTGFLLFYALFMLALYTAYSKLIAM